MFRQLRLGGSVQPWYLTNGVAGILPSLSIDFEGNRYAISQAPKSFGDIFTFTRNSTATGTSALGLITSYLTDEERLEYSTGTRGYLGEVSRTNYQQNSEMVGASISPSTFPTGWNFTGGGFTHTVVGTGTEYGRKYVDVRMQVDSFSSVTRMFFMPDADRVPCAQNDVFTSSLCTKIVGGSKTNITGIIQAISQNEAGGGYIGELSKNITDEITEGFNQHISTKTLTSESVGLTRHYFYMYGTAGQPIDITIRFYSPQFEKGAFRTSYIPTSGSTAIRAVDKNVLSTEAFNAIDQTKMTILVDFEQLGFSESATQTIFRLDDETDNNRILLFADSSSNVIRFIVTTGGVLQCNLASSVQALNSRTKIAFTLSSTRAAMSINGGTVLEDTSVTLPTGLTRGAIGSQFGVNVCNGSYYELKNIALEASDATLQEITTL